MPSIPGIDKNDFMNMAPKEARGVQYSLFAMVLENQRKLQKMKYINTVIIGITGLMGGAVAHWVQSGFFKGVGP
ncbi:MAG: hypothetical protein GY861_24365 [bacterium]|nr:hypothetical protein [bacterium]